MQRIVTRSTTIMNRPLTSSDHHSSILVGTSSRSSFARESPEDQEEGDHHQHDHESTTSSFWGALTWSEISGAFGDLGTFIPLYVALSRQQSIHASSALFLSGMINIITGYYFDLPIPVQPMKSICALALIDGLTRSQVTTAGIWMGIFLLFLGGTGLIECVNRLVPSSVVAGMQMGVGISLAIKACHMIEALSWFNKIDCLTLAAFGSLVCFYLLKEPNTNNSTNSSTNSIITNRSPKPIIGIYLFLVGAIIAAIQLIKKENSFTWSPTAPMIWAIKGISWRDWQIGLLGGALPQLPLTTMNSVISVCSLAHSLFPEKRRGDSQTDGVLSRRSVCISIGLMNLLLCPFGGLPSCHGAGGLAGQHKFGARRGASVVFLGIGKVILTLVMGDGIVPFFDEIPIAILGIMLAIAGHELAFTGFSGLIKMASSPSLCVESSSTRLRTDSAIAILTAIVVLSTQKTHYGALIGLVAHLVYGDGITECLAPQRHGTDQPEYVPLSLSEELNEQEVDTTRNV